MERTGVLQKWSVGIGLLTDPIRGDTKPERLNIPTPNDPNGTDGSPFPTFDRKFIEQLTL